MKHLLYVLKCYSTAASLLALLLLNPGKIFSQGTSVGSLDYLNRCNGFKNIALGSNAEAIPNYKLSFLDGDDQIDADSCLRFEYRDDRILTINNVANLVTVGLRTYKNKIVNIYLFFKREDGRELLKYFIESYGKFTSKPGNFMYDWDTNAVKLALRFQIDCDYGVAIFTSNSMENLLSQLKQKEKLNGELSAVNTSSF